MMRVCHLNTCPVGVATQDPELRKKFAGKPEYVINFFRFVAEDLRQIMSRLGFRTIDEMVGRSEKLDVKHAVEHWKAKGLDFSKILYKPDIDPSISTRCTQKQDHGIDQALDHELIAQAGPALERGEKVVIDVQLRNIHRTVGAMLSHEISKIYGAAGLPDDTITVNAVGCAGQSFGGFSARGITFNVKGDANDYFGKGLSGAKLIIRPPEGSTFAAEKNILIGNVSFYGAIQGEAFINGLAGERFCVRNSGAITVVEGIGDHGCEYMTGGRAVILGPTGRNFAAGMSGGIAYVLDESGDFIANRCNPEMVDFDPLEKKDEVFLRERVEKHLSLTGSALARRLLADWENTLKKFVKVIPVDYKKALAILADEQKTGE
jgi:glutamate synthase (ferredoxin)